MKFALLLFCIFLLPIEAYAQPNDQSGADPDAIRRCQSYLDCTLVWGGCGDDAINKQYVAQYKPSTACLQSTAHNPKAIPTCTDHLCVAIVPDEKK